ncbi:MAG: hypothetical protein AB1705_18565 [Verrucomicrobiota bacterium]
MKTTLELPDELIREIKIRSIHQRKKLKDSVAELLRLGLAVSATKQPGAGKKGRIRLPLFPCAKNAPVRRMSDAQINALMHETQTKEDLERLGLPV